MHLRTQFGDHLILGSRQETHIKDQNGNGWRDLVARAYKIDSGHSAYINGTGSGNTRGAGDISGTNNNGQPVLMASGIRADLLAEQDGRIISVTTEIDTVKGELKCCLYST